MSDTDDTAPTRLDAPVQAIYEHNAALRKQLPLLSLSGDAPEAMRTLIEHLRIVDANLASLQGLVHELRQDVHDEIRRLWAALRTRD